METQFLHLAFQGFAPAPVSYAIDVGHPFTSSWMQNPAVIHPKKQANLFSLSSSTSGERREQPYVM